MNWWLDYVASKICEKGQPIQWENLHGYPRIRQSELCPPLIMSNGKKINVCCQIFKYSFERFFGGNMCVSQCLCCQLFLRILAIFCYGEIFEAATFFLVPPSLTLGLLFLESLTAFQKLVSFSNLKFLSYEITQFQFN